MRGCVNKAPNQASHVAAVSPLCVPKRRRFSSARIVKYAVSSPSSLAVLRAPLWPISNKQRGDIAGLRQQKPQTKHHIMAAVSPLCVPKRRRFSSARIVKYAVSSPKPAVLRAPRPISNKQRGDIAGLRQQKPQTKHHMWQRCPRFAFPSADVFPLLES